MVPLKKFVTTRKKFSRNFAPQEWYYNNIFDIVPGNIAGGTGTQKTPTPVIPFHVFKSSQIGDKVIHKCVLDNGNRR